MFKQTGPQHGATPRRTAPRVRATSEVRVGQGPQMHLSSFLPRELVNDPPRSGQVLHNTRKRLGPTSLLSPLDVLNNKEQPSLIAYNVSLANMIGHVAGSRFDTPAMLH